MEGAESRKIENAPSDDEISEGPSKTEIINRLLGVGRNKNYLLGQ